MDAFIFPGQTFARCSFWSSRSEKTLFVSTPKRPGAQIWQTNLLWPMSSPSPPPPHLKLLDKKVTAMCFHTINDNPFKTVIWQESDRWCPPPPNETASENDLTLCVSIPSMRTHSKQSFDKKVTGDVLPPNETASENNLTLCQYPYHQWEPIWNSHLMRNWQVMSSLPHLKLPEHRVISLLFNVVNESPFETVNL